jgi:hypothetical protein
MTVEELVRNPIQAAVSYLSPAINEKTDLTKLLRCVDEHVVVKNGFEALLS